MRLYAVAFSYSILILISFSDHILATYNPIYNLDNNDNKIFSNVDNNINFNNNNNNIDLFRYSINGEDLSNSNNNNGAEFDDGNNLQILALEEEQDINLASLKNAKGRRNRYGGEEIYILEDKDYPKSLFEHYPGVGQVSGITTLPSGDVAIFHRPDREWTEKTFNANYTLSIGSAAADNLIKNDTIMIINADDGSAVTTFGSNLFYMPHSIASDNDGNLWISDVARHQVMRLPTSMMQLEHVDSNGKQTKRWLPGNLTRIWPDIILGEPFVPGADTGHFCQPSEIEISSDGRLVFVADGYCNRRVMVFTGSGKFLTSFGEEQNMNVVHSLTLIEERNLICVADRENGKIFCYQAGLDGNLDQIGQLALSLKYPLGKVFAIEAISSNHLLVSSNQVGTSKFDMAALNPFTSELKQTWTSSDLLAPHSLAKTNDGSYVYAADISKEAFKKVFKFNIIQRIR